MLFHHPDHPERGVRLAYCLNLHPAETLAGVIGGMEEITLPLAERLQATAPTGGRFGVGAWLAAAVAVPLGVGEGLEEYVAFVRDRGLDPFTYNAFPYGGFHRPGLKSGVFQPTWADTARVVYTQAAATVAARAWAGCGRLSSHVSISTHSGGFGADIGSAALRDRCVENLVRVAGLFARLEREHGCRIVLSVEAEPRASAGTTEEVAALLADARGRADVLVREQNLAPDEAFAVVRRHLGACLDACHAAVEFEEPADAFLAATRDGAPLGKIQFSSALELKDPKGNAVARERLLALDEPVYLHQTTGRRPGGELVRATDLTELRDAFASNDERWLATDLLRCHFHVPVDLGAVGEEAGGLGTTRRHADELLAVALADPERWGTEELHLEIETYTWDVLPGEARGPGSLVDGLEREYAHVEARLNEAGWHRAESTDGSRAES